MQQLRIPTAFQAIGKNTEGSLHERSNSAERPQALIIDDQPAIRDMLSWMLHLQGYQSSGVVNGQAALDWIDQAQLTREYPAVILLDLLMPLAKGTKVLASLREHWRTPTPFPPIILLTVVKSDYDFLECSNVLVKPFHFVDLCECLRLARTGSNIGVAEG